MEDSASAGVEKQDRGSGIRPTSALSFISRNILTKDIFFASHHSLAHLKFLLSVLLYASLAFNPRIWLHRMPPEVIQKVPPKTSAEKRLFFATVGTPFLLLLFAYPVIYVLQQPSDWLNTFWILCAFFVGFAMWDTLILDLLIFCKLTPSFVIISGTERQDYANMKYHVVSGAKGLGLSIIFSGILATVLYWI